MPYSLSLSKFLKAQGWKVKIRDRERVELPHVTVMHNDREWRIGLRDSEFLVPPGGNWKDLDSAVRQEIRSEWEKLKIAWDQMYPENPISSED